MNVSMHVCNKIFVFIAIYNYFIYASMQISRMEILQRMVSTLSWIMNIVIVIIFTAVYDL